MSYFTPVRRQPAPGADRSAEGIERLTRDCLALGGGIADELIEREISTAVADSRWDDAVHWQRVRLRVNRLRARGSA